MAHADHWLQFGADYDLNRPGIRPVTKLPVGPDPSSTLPWNSAGIRGNTGRAAYGAAKGGVLTLTKVMAVELAPRGIRVNAIAPGPIETPLVRDMHTQEARARWMDTVPQHRYASGDELAGAALFLLDERRSSFVTGQTICVDGGFTAAGLIAEPHR